MITAEEVFYAYKFFLGREPENAEVVAGYCQNTQTIDELSQIFMSSPEFTRRLGSTLEKTQANQHRHPFHLPRIPVETQVSIDLLHKMFTRIHSQWDNLGATEPYWSVVTQPQNYIKDFEKSRMQFYASGSIIAQNFTATLRRSGINLTQLDSCLEIGCGVGRVTHYLTSIFKNVIGADISVKHIEIAKKFLEENNVENFQLIYWDNLEKIEKIPKVDAILSVITFQHNPPPLMLWMLSKLLSRLNRGGVAYIQIPTYKNGYLFEAERYFFSQPSELLEMHYLPQYEVFKAIAEANCRCLEVREDGMVSNENQTLSNTFLIQKN